MAMVEKALIHSLDGLVERYLNLVHQYQILRQDLSLHLSDVSPGQLKALVCVAHYK